MIIFIGVNKSGSASLHAVEPSRNEQTGKWESYRPYVNSIIQKNMNDMIRHSNMTWAMDPEFIEININKQTRIIEDERKI